MITGILLSGMPALGESQKQPITPATAFEWLKQLSGPWYQWKDNPQLHPTTVEPMVVVRPVRWKLEVLSAWSYALLATSVGVPPVDGQIYSLIAFERRGDDTVCRIYTRNVLADGVLEPQPVLTLDYEGSTSKSLIWRKRTGGGGYRFEFVGSGEAMRMLWSEWDETQRRWNDCALPFRRDPPPDEVIPKPIPIPTEK